MIINMARADFHGRLQKITKGRIRDLVTTYNLACNSQFELDSELMLFKDGEHSKAIDRKDELGFLGNLDGIIIGIGGADPPEIAPEQRTKEWSQSAKIFFDPAKNPLTYFQRMVILKDLMISKGIPVEKVDFVPKYPHHYYPSSVGRFESKPEDFAFQYLGVESDHHFHRIQTKGPNERNITVLYHDFRNYSSSKSRDESIDLNLPNFDKRIFNLYVKRFNLMEDGSYGELTEKSLGVMFEDSMKSGNDSVLAIGCYPKKADRDFAEERWGKPFGEVMKNTPFERYMLLKEYIIKNDVNPKKTHITFVPPDIFIGKTPSRSESYIPNKFIYFTEDLDSTTMKTKNERFGNHPNCIETRFTNI